WRRRGGCRLTTSWFDGIRGPGPGLLQPVVRPPPPALGHSGNRKQPIDFLVITGVDAKYVPNGETMIGPLDDPDLISGPHIALDDNSQIRPGPQRLGEAARKPLVVHPDSKPPARDPRLGYLKHRGPDLPPLSDERLVQLNPFRREIFPKLTGCKRSADLLFPPPCGFDGVCVDCFIGPPVCLAIRLVVSGKIDTSGRDPPDDR